MPAISPEGIRTPAGSDNYALTNDLRLMGNSLRTIVPVPNAAARNAIVAAMLTEGRPVSTTNVLVVHRQDTGVVESSVNGTDWTRWIGPSVDLPITLSLWASTLFIRQEVSTKGFRMTMGGRLRRTSGAFTLTNAWVGIGTVVVPTDMQPNLGDSDLIMTAQALPDGTNLSTPVTVLLNTVSGAVSIRSVHGSQSWTANGVLRLDQAAVWYRDL